MRYDESDGETLSVRRMQIQEEAAAKRKMIHLTLTWSVLGLLILTLALMIGYPKYNVWQQAMSGKAKLAEAEFSRKVAVCEAEAKKESAIYWGEAEITKAKAMAEANHILANSLKNNHEYLMYLWIESLKETRDKIVYVPTEGSLPILESTRFLETFNQPEK